MQVYTTYLMPNGFDIEPLYHTIRGQYGASSIVTAMIRGFTDIKRLFISIHPKRIKIVHILGQYRGAIARELLTLMIARSFGKYLVYDIKAGAFEAAYLSGSTIYKYAVRYIVANADLVLAEGNATVEFVRREMGILASYFPNFIADSDVPKVVAPRLQGRTIRILFCGYCSEDKGILDILSGCEIATRAGVNLELKIIGDAPDDVRRKIWKFISRGDFPIAYLERQPHSLVLEAMREADIYLYPTRHPGEGHNNSVTEAMAQGAIVVATRRGFLIDVLGEENGVWLRVGDAAEIASKLQWISKSRTDHVQLGLRAHERVQNRYVATSASAALEAEYNEMILNGRAGLGGR